MKVSAILTWLLCVAIVVIAGRTGRAQCEFPGPFCDSISAYTECIQICPAGDIDFVVVVRDYCGNPICASDTIWLQFNACENITPCLDAHPEWPRVRPDSCNAETGEHFFSVKASGGLCMDCEIYGVVEGFLCAMLPVRFLDQNYSGTVTAGDFVPGNLCSDYNCDFVTDAADQALHDSHLGHACSVDPLPCCVGVTGDLNDDALDETDIADLTRLVNFLFVTFEPLSCPAEGNVNGVLPCEVDIADLTRMVNHLFVTFEPLPLCNVACE